MKYAICNELFEGQPLEQYLPLVAGLGYTGLEVAPFAFDRHLADTSADEARALGRRIRSFGVDVIGMHWLLARTQGLHINSPDRDARDRATAYMTMLIRRCGDLGAGIMVFGSPVQRAVLPGVSEEQAFDYAATFFRRVAPVAQEGGVTIAIEPLARDGNNFIYTKDQAVRLIEAVGHPAVGLHLDVRAMSDEGRPIPDLIRESKQYLRHFHANDADLGPGMGPIDFHPIYRALQDVGYDGWVSVEVFDFSPGSERIARESIQYLKRIEAEL